MSNDKPTEVMVETELVIRYAWQCPKCGTQVISIPIFTDNPDSDDPISGSYREPTEVTCLNEFCLSSFVTKPRPGEV